LAAKDGQVIPWERPRRPPVLRSSMNVDWTKLSFYIAADGRRVRVIGLIPDQIITEQLVEELPALSGELLADPERDISKLAVIERHLATGNVGLGFVKGLGLQRGAIASTVAHDHHNIVVAGADDKSMFMAMQAIVATRGGMAVADGDTVLAQLPLPIAGLMSDQPIETVRRQMDELLAAARQLGSSLHNPFMALSFLSLPVIPSLKLTDRGLVDVDKFQLVSLFADA
jgi:adenine deaminase